MADGPVAEKVIELPAGGLEVHHPSLPHRSPPNTSSARWRRVLVCRYQPASEPLTGGPVMPWWPDATPVPKVNFLVRGAHPALPAGTDLAEIPGLSVAAQGAPAIITRLPPWEAHARLATTAINL
jgi:hypothetical protein